MQETISEETTELEETSELEEKLTLITKLGYGTGAVIYEMCSSTWFTYALLFYSRVLGFTNSLVGFLFVFCLISDAFLVVFVGYFQDYGKDYWLCRKYSKRKGWHLFGSLCLILCDPFLYASCIGCVNAPHGQQIVYYCFFLLMVNLGFGSAQISHLALIPELTASKIERTSLTSYQYGTKILCNVVMYVTLWVFLGSDGEESIGPSSANIFRNVKLITVGVGAITALVFHVVVPVDDRTKKSAIVINTLAEKKAGIYGKSLNISNLQKSMFFKSLTSAAFMSEINLEATYTDKSSSAVQPMRMSDWLRETQFWKVSLLYISARLFSNLSLAYIALYLDVTLQLRPTNIAIVPLVMFLSGLCASTLLDTLVRICGQRGALFIACLIGLTGSVWVGCRNFNSNSFRSTEIYVVAALFGSAGSGFLISGVSAIANLVGEKVESAALVYGLISMTERIATGIAFGVIQELVPDDNQAERRFYRNILGFVCGGLTILAILAALMMEKSTIEEKVDNEVHRFYKSKLSALTMSVL